MSFLVQVWHTLKIAGLKEVHVCLSCFSVLHINAVATFEMLKVVVGEHTVERKHISENSSKFRKGCGIYKYQCSGFGSSY